MEFKLNHYYWHSTRKQWGLFDADCRHLTAIERLTDNIFLVFNGELLQVTKSLISAEKNALTYQDINP